MFVFNDAATTEIYTLSLHDTLPFCQESCASPRTPQKPRNRVGSVASSRIHGISGVRLLVVPPPPGDRKSTRLNSSHANISYAVFCLKKQELNYINHHVLSVLSDYSG